MDGMGTVSMRQVLDVYAPKIYPEVFAQPLSNAEVQQTSESGSGAFSITDGTGTMLSFNSPPARVICLFHECVELMAALGVQPVAILAPSWLPNFAGNPDYFPQPNTIVKLKETSDGSWDYEQIASLKPDIVFGSDDDRTALVGIAQVYSAGSSYSMSYQDTEQHLRELAVLLDRTQQAEQTIARYERRLKAYAEQTPAERLSVMLVASDTEMVWLYSGQSVPCSVLNAVARCDWPNPQPSPGSWGYSTSIEGLLKLDPDVIIFENWSTNDTEAALATLRANPLWAELSGVKSGRVLPMRDRDAYGLGPAGAIRLLDSYVPLIYPESFSAPLTDAKVDAIVAD
jgi:ABC-type Fe3+-hydroxamate transport system substrate-binding protein